MNVHGLEHQSAALLLPQLASQMVTPTVASLELPQSLGSMQRLTSISLAAAAYASLPPLVWLPPPAHRAPPAALPPAPPTPVKLSTPPSAPAVLPPALQPLPALQLQLEDATPGSKVKGGPLELPMELRARRDHTGAERSSRRLTANCCNADQIAAIQQHAIGIEQPNYPGVTLTAFNIRNVICTEVNGACSSFEYIVVVILPAPSPPPPSPPPPSPRRSSSAGVGGEYTDDGDR